MYLMCMWSGATKATRWTRRESMDGYRIPSSDVPHSSPTLSNLLCPAYRGVISMIWTVIETVRLDTLQLHARTHSTRKREEPKRESWPKIQSVQIVPDPSTWSRNQV